jgi:methyl-accepting chemotaxis protein
MGDVQRASGLVRREAEYSGATSNKISLKTDGLVAQAGGASRDLTLFAAAIEELARSSDRAGEAGRGFAVVASEVKKLSQKKRRKPPSTSRRKSMRCRATPPIALKRCSGSPT